ncbi:3'-5' exonuclease [Sporosarcina sp. E16_8]|uniref:3'-5' exonuclease n=1 Tax=Sporosarcina sp. E16_8 TaxID=2789295 RepID=UPI001A9259BB|nr:3'-5' exonuclease [Sporosarcina sp. E16_8]MBO0587463.1 exonuclease domain-containing protein [Sporosarcina sp. E16_8]
MQYIVFDLEATMSRTTDMPQYIIEIGAAKVSDVEGELKIVDTFQSYVKPPQMDLLDKRTLRFIGGTADQFINSPNMVEVVQRFRKWIGEEDYYLCSWSNSDLRLLVHHYAKERFDLSWVKNFNDIQRPICVDVFQENRQISLEEALTMSGIEQDGELHSACDDAVNTAKLLVKNIKDIVATTSDDPFVQIICALYRNCFICGKTTRHNDLHLNEKGKKTNKCNACWERISEENLAKELEGKANIKV